MANVILFVKDLNREVAFYRDVLGLEVEHPRDTEDYSKAGWVELDAGGCVLALHDGGQGRIGEDAPTVTFLVDDLEAARQSVVDKGVPMGKIEEIAPGVFISSGTDPEGFGFTLEELR